MSTVAAKPHAVVGAAHLAEPARQIERLVKASARYPRLAVFGGLIGVLILMGVFAPLLAPYDPLQTAPTQVLAQPSPAHLLGTDNVGRDQFSRVIYGARISLGVAVIAVTIALCFGLSMGLAAGYIGGWTDQALSRLVDAMLAFPGVLLAIAITSALGPSLRNAMIAVGIIQIPVLLSTDARSGAPGARTRVHNRGRRHRRVEAAHPGPPHPAEYRQSADCGGLDLQFNGYPGAGRARLHRRRPAAARS